MLNKMMGKAKGKRNEGFNPIGKIMGDKHSKNLGMNPSMGGGSSLIGGVPFHSLPITPSKPSPPTKVPSLPMPGPVPGHGISVPTMPRLSPISKTPTIPPPSPAKGRMRIL